MEVYFYEQYNCIVNVSDLCMEGFVHKSLYIGVLQVDNGLFQPYSAAVNKCYDERLYSLKKQCKQTI